MQGAHIFPDNRLCTPFVSNSDHRSLINRILVTGKTVVLLHLSRRRAAAPKLERRDPRQRKGFVIVALAGGRQRQNDAGWCSLGDP